jgi:serine/threonine protein phosphatase PrpC
MKWLLLVVRLRTQSDFNQNHQLTHMIVADGMGGHAGGDQAARLTLRTIGTMLAERRGRRLAPRRLRWVARPS